MEGLQSSVSKIYRSIPKSTRGKIRFLSKRVGISPHTIRDLSEDQALRTLAGVTIYHHVNKRQQTKILQQIYALPRPHQSKFLTKITDPLVNQHWGLWSLSTEELINLKEVHEIVSNIGEATGAGISVKTAKDFKDILNNWRETGSIVKLRFFATLIVGLFFLNNEGGRIKVDDELISRL